jgi:hypothetical protein
MFENIGFKFGDLVSKGLPPGSSSLANIFGDIYEQYPERYNFYINLLESISSSNPNAVYELFQKENLTRNQRTKVNAYVKDIKTYFANNREALQDIYQNVLTGTSAKDKIKEVYVTVPLSEMVAFDETKTQPHTGASANETLIEAEIKAIIAAKFTQQVGNDQAERTKAKNLMIRRKKTLLSLKKLNDRLKNNVTTSENGFGIGAVKPKTLDAVQSGGASLEDFANRYLPSLPAGESILKRIDASKKFDTTEADATTLNAVQKKEKADEVAVRPIVRGMREGFITDDMKETYLADPIYGPEPEKVLMTDRVIFVVATYIIRAVALFMVEWGVHTNFINTFVKGFSLYFGVYMCIFLLLVILANAREDEYIFRMIFFYINTQSEGGRGIVRLIVHTLCVVMLIPIPFVVRDLREFEKDSMTFSEKRTILSGIEKFTLYAWILTSVVALKV